MNSFITYHFVLRSGKEAVSIFYTIVLVTFGIFNYVLRGFIDDVRVLLWAKFPVDDANII